ncbi:hypothetical protein C1Y63_09520 [Corynebacterium sp. 13CS0277]|uniref:hypothetical protein n=1 Tax=Corynebacterium sp. 13CS0277 TaxID=2071994 RepID=UPI000D03FB0E|nr:hypothetical protein [Corynebacterium sp. 13CS0277]PRQ10779.1 hypothetical protein C1Y63_09520 [Corynebacterium sp. 13CS0277]
MSDVVHTIESPPAARATGVHPGGARPAVAPQGVALVALPDAAQPLTPPEAGATPSRALARETLRSAASAPAVIHGRRAMAPQPAGAPAAPSHQPEDAARPLAVEVSNASVVYARARAMAMHPSRSAEATSIARLLQQARTAQQPPTTPVPGPPVRGAEASRGTPPGAAPHDDGEAAEAVTGAAPLRAPDPPPLFPTTFARMPGCHTLQVLTPAPHQDASAPDLNAGQDAAVHGLAAVGLGLPGTLAADMDTHSTVASLVEHALAVAHGQRPLRDVMTPEYSPQVRVECRNRRVATGRAVVVLGELRVLHRPRWHFATPAARLRVRYLKAREDALRVAYDPPSPTAADLAREYATDAAGTRAGLQVEFNGTFRARGAKGLLTGMCVHTTKGWQLLHLRLSGS